MEGFFKGVGKGLLGLITKPTGGAVDMISMAFDGIRRWVSFDKNILDIFANILVDYHNLIYFKYIFVDLLSWVIMWLFV